MPLLQANNLTKRFGGLTAVNKVTFDIEPGEILGVIGPNGAGKTTMFNLISGLHQPTEGQVIFNNDDIGKLKPHLRCHKGIGRTFQIVRPFEMTVLENVMVPALNKAGSTKEAREIAMQALETAGLTDHTDMMPANLTLAGRKRLEVARALATRPKLLLLDEVLAGLNPTEVQNSLPLLRSIRDNGVTILMIEHIMDALMNVSDRVIVMDQGALIASGTPAQVTRDPKVIKAYLGEEVSHVEN